MSEKKEIGQVYAREDEVNKDEYYVTVGYVDMEDQDLRRLTRELSGIQYTARYHIKALEELGRKEAIAHNILWQKIGDVVPEAAGRVSLCHKFNEYTGEISRKTTWQERQEIEKEFMAAKLEALEILKGSNYICEDCTERKGKEFKHWRKSAIGKKHAGFEKPLEEWAKLTIEAFLERKILPTGEIR